jgi:ATP-binding cassette, subfamily G (WHITE), member 2, PDR
MICDLPSKIITSVSVSLVIYFMTNLRREPGPFFLFLLFSFMCTLCMSMIFRTACSSTRSIAQATTPAGIIILGLIIYTGFVIPTRDMVVWFRWINYISPIAYAFEVMMVNEFDGRTYPCTQFIPNGLGYENATGLERICSTKGAVPGSSVVEGAAYLSSSFEYYRTNVWRSVLIYDPHS